MTDMKNRITARDPYALARCAKRGYLAEQGIAEPISPKTPPRVLMRWLMARPGSLERAGLLPTVSEAMA